MLEPVPLPPAGARVASQPSAVRAWLTEVVASPAGTFVFPEAVFKSNTPHLRGLAPRGITLTTRRISHLGNQAPRGFTWLYATKEGTT